MTSKTYRYKGHVAEPANPLNLILLADVMPLAVHFT